MAWQTVCLTSLWGCATFNTLNDTETPLLQRQYIYSGTRLDWAAITENAIALRKFNVKPPAYPLADLPLSFTLDSLFLPFALCTEFFH
ncbi:MULTISPECIES: YceK/YidQ family lipoprotein [Methylomonas]|uniref:YceK/YidQ family lipoprotein n=1 Tax=Methylomonas TaxID=416 RepID=UPI0018D7F1E9|nr:YceK/YidQ family lipoprotein [Methylomonas rhizoryzae]